MTYFYVEIMVFLDVVASGFIYVCTVGLQSNLKMAASVHTKILGTCLMVSYMGSHPRRQ
jgi:hypothetical protein